MALTIGMLNLAKWLAIEVAELRHETTGDVFARLGNFIAWHEVSDHPPRDGQEPREGEVPDR